MNPPFHAELLEILACPACEHRPPLRWQEEIIVPETGEPDAMQGAREKLSEGALVCDECRRAYPIRNGIPVLLVEEAIQLP